MTLVLVCAGDPVQNQDRSSLLWLGAGLLTKAVEVSRKERIDLGSCCISPYPCSHI